MKRQSGSPGPAQWLVEEKRLVQRPGTNKPAGISKKAVQDKKSEGETEEKRKRDSRREGRRHGHAASAMPLPLCPTDRLLLPPTLGEEM